MIVCVKILSNSISEVILYLFIGVLESLARGFDRVVVICTISAENSGLDRTCPVIFPFNIEGVFTVNLVLSCLWLG